ncbi:sulfite exporter TauE/SafE family protein [Jeongeupia naejangsanensis]|uniref:Probable membrane transporter protein n=1 Tax=Jeongeupia naejangsanensis TaxID=613195 RepID=A0ABS2BN66_9NEIS|nr:sulfite exporter TauE/SafE family protein [Jeongeupia naejangsanensis]MBM3116870.1 sulfite exporter TauE/SafE family protein [Jeongeupia naejangsanensis]
MTVVVLGLLIGLVLGLSGAGGGILAVPALMAGLGWSVQQAAPVALLAVAGGAATGALEGFRRGLVRYRAALVMALAGIPLTAAGQAAARHLPHTALQTAFALVMLTVAGRLLLPRHDDDRAYPPCRVDPDSGRLVWTPATAAAITVVGALAGFATGLLGVGGGFIIVPALRRLSNLGMHAIVATSLFVIALVGCGGIAAALWQGRALPLAVALPFLIATVAGMITGRRLIARVSPQRVQRGFALVLLAVALGMLAATWWPR